LKAIAAVIVGIGLTLLVLGCGRNTTTAGKPPTGAAAAEGIPIEIKAALSKSVSPATAPGQEDVEDYSIILTFTNAGEYTASILEHGGTLQKSAGAAAEAAGGELVLKPKGTATRAIDTVAETTEVLSGLKPGGYLELGIAITPKDGTKGYVYKTDVPPLDQLPLQDRDGAMTIRLMAPGEKVKAPAKGEGEGEGEGD
jgi:hypothetical protein